MKEKGILKKKMIRLVFPIAFQQFMIALVGACDAVMLGKLSQNSMSAVSLASQVTFVFNLFMTAFVLKIPVLGVYFVLNLDEIVKLPVVYRHYRKYGWVKNIT